MSECHFCEKGVRPFYAVHQVVSREGNSITIGDEKSACHTCKHTRNDIIEREAVIQHLQMQAQAQAAHAAQAQAAHATDEETENSVRELAEDEAAAEDTPQDAALSPPTDEVKRGKNLK